MPGKKYSYYNYESSKFLEDSGVEVKPTLPTVMTPKNAIKAAEENIEPYRRIIEENRHASFIDKSKIILQRGKNWFKKGSSHELGNVSKTEGLRQDRLNNAFNTHGKYILDLSTYFSHCKNRGLIDNYVAEIKADYKKLLAKGYIKKDVLTKVYVPNKQFDPAPFRIIKDNLTDQETKYYINNCSKPYFKLYNKFYDILSDLEDSYQAVKKSAIEISDDCMDNFETYVEKINTLKEKFEESKTILNAETEIAISKLTGQDAENTKKHIQSIKENAPKIEKKLNQLIKEAKNVNFNAIFSSNKAIAVPNNIVIRLQTIADLLNKIVATVGSKSYSTSDLKQLYIEAAEKLRDPKTQQYIDEFKSVAQLGHQVPKNKDDKDKRTLLLLSWNEAIKSRIATIDASIDEIEENCEKLTKYVEEYQMYLAAKNQQEMKKKLVLGIGLTGVLIGQFGGLVNAILSPDQPNFEPID